MILHDMLLCDMIFRKGCQKTCHQRHVIQKCQCVLSYYPRYGVPFGNSNVSMCDDDNPTQSMLIINYDHPYYAILLLSLEQFHYTFVSNNHLLNATVY